MTSPDFKRRVTSATTQITPRIDLDEVFVEFWFDGAPHPIQPKLNRKGEPFVPTLPSVMASLKESATNNKEKGAKTIFTESVSNVATKKSAEMPRNAKQVTFFRILRNIKHKFNSLNMD